MGADPRAQRADGQQAKQQQMAAILAKNKHNLAAVKNGQKIEFVMAYDQNAVLLIGGGHDQAASKHVAGSHPAKGVIKVVDPAHLAVTVEPRKALLELEHELAKITRAKVSYGL